MSSILSINPSDPNPILAQVPSVIAGFWRRLLAAGLDMLIVGTVGFILGLIFFDPFMRLGQWGRLLGFAIALPYFCLFNSSIGGGQTIGKRLFGVRVVNGPGELISPARAAARYGILSLPFFLNGMFLPIALGGTVLGTTIDVIVFAGGGAIIYLYVFNRATRQSLHDLIVGTYVIDSATHGKVGVRPVWKGHAFVLPALLLGIVGVGKAVELRLDRSHDFSALSTIIEKLTKSGKVYGATVVKLASAGTDGIGHSLVVGTRWRGRPSNLRRTTTDIASMVLDQDPNILGQDTMVITVSYGFDIGIASGWRRYTDSGTPSEWKVKISQTNTSR